MSDEFLSPEFMVQLEKNLEKVQSFLRLAERYGLAQKKPQPVGKRPVGRPRKDQQDVDRRLKLLEEKKGVLNKCN